MTKFPEDLSIRMHMTSDPDVNWSRVNAIEAFPEMVKPLCWDFVCAGINRMWAKLLAGFGSYTLGDPLPWGAEHGYLGLFYGRTAININRLQASSGVIPSGNAEDITRFIVSSGSIDDPCFGKGGVEGFDMDDYHKRVEQMQQLALAEDKAMKRWWSESTSSKALADRSDLAERYREAAQRYEDAQRSHQTTSTVCQNVFGRVVRLCEDVARPDLAQKLMTGYGDTVDTASVFALWNVSRGKRSLDSYLLDFGYYCSHGDDLSSPSWRENPAVLTKLIRTYETMDDAVSPVATEDKRVASRIAAEHEMLDLLSGDRQQEAQDLFFELQHHTRLREMGKSTYKKAIDVGRAICRIRGEWLAETGYIAARDDIFFLSEEEAFFCDPVDFHARIAERSAQIAAFERLQIPMAWTGDPIPEGKAPEAAVQLAVGEPITGIGASSGRVEGRARVVLDQDNDAEMEPGDILVTHTTEPSWAPFFIVASAVVIDIGGQFSHGAIIARELGIPCVINTQNGTVRIRDGDWLDVDGDTGTVTVLVRAKAKAPI